MRPPRVGMSTGVAAIGMIVLLVVGGGVGYYLGLSSASSTTNPAATTVTVTSTATVTGTGAGGAFAAGTDPLVAACQAEGGTVNYLGYVDPAKEAVVQKPLSAQYPWLKVVYTNLPTGQIATKTTTEFQAGHVTQDVAGMSLSQEVSLQKAGGVQQWTNPIEAMMNYSSTSVDQNNYWHPLIVTVLVIQYNTNLVSSSQLPKNWYDLANPVWKGKLAFQNPSGLGGIGNLFATLAASTTNQTATNFFKALVANNPIITSDSGTTYTDIGSGQAAIGFALLDDYISGIGKAPVGVVVPQKTYASASPIMLLKNAPHPACGELLIEWLTSYVGQQAMFVGAGDTPMFTPLATQLEGKYIPAGTQIVPTGVNSDVFTNSSKWHTYFAGIFGP